MRFPAWLQREGDTLAAVASGLLLALAFPRPGLALLAWVALVPLLLVATRRPFRCGFAAGLAFYAVLLYWLNVVMTSFGHLHPLLSGVAWLLLSAYLALFWGATFWLCRRFRERLSVPLLVSVPLVWTALDYLREFLLTGFPWGALGYSQIEHLWLVQSADLFGVYGLTALLVFSNMAIAETLKRRRAGRWPVRPLLVMAVLFLFNAGYGIWRLDGSPDRRPESLAVTLAQGNIDQSVKWDPAWQQETVRRYLKLSREGVEAGGRLIVWPESATPFYFQEGKELSRLVVDFTRENATPLLFGSPAYRAAGSSYVLLNSAYLLSAEGRVQGRSDKVHLVPFGEYVPLKRFLPFINKLVVGIGDFSPGTLTPLELDGHSIGVLVCYEGIFPELSRTLVDQGADVLVNITNDAWYGRTSAPYQHLAMARMRAIENRVWLARAANTGVSALIAPSGTLTATTPIFETLQVTAQAGLGARPTLYRTLGDSLPALLLLLTLAGFLRSLKRTEVNDALD